MSKQQEFVKNAVAELGNGPAKFRDWYYGKGKWGSGASSGIPWCAIFVSNISSVTGLVNKLVKTSAGAGDIPRYSIPAGFGLWLEGNATPQPGDIVLFTWNGQGSYAGQDKYFSDHIGIVEKVEGKTVHVIEGNAAPGTNDTTVVRRKTYQIPASANNTVINGYYRPDWKLIGETNTAVTTVKTTAVDPNKDAKVVNYKATVNATAGLNVRKGPGVGYNVVSGLANKASVTITAEKNGWGKIGTDKWVCLDYVKKVTTTATPVKTATPAAADIFYMVRVDGKWLTAVKNLDDFAGVKGKKITDIAIKVSAGSVKYRVHILGGKWLPYVTGYSTSDHNNGYAGNGQVIDAIEIIYTPPVGQSRKIQYWVAPVGKSYYPEQVGNTKSATMDGYAGAFGTAIDRVQMRVY